ncbi:unnamed protein product [Calypogeia fissa]
MWRNVKTVAPAVLNYVQHELAYGTLMGVLWLCWHSPKMTVPEWSLQPRGTQEAPKTPNLDQPRDTVKPARMMLDTRPEIKLANSSALCGSRHQ